VQTREGARTAEKLKETLVTSDPEAYIASCQAVAGIDFRDSNCRIAKPTLVIAGTRDEATPPVMSQEIASAVPGSRLVKIEGAHLSAVERPADFNRLLQCFWAELNLSK
jgi:3-oxoadipate enol-lactonase